MGELPHVLMIDDEERGAASLEAALTAAGHRVKVVPSLLRAQEAIATEAPDALLVARQMIPLLLSGQGVTPSAGVGTSPWVEYGPAGADVLSKLTSEAVRIQEEERRKLSLELHDDIIQVMATLVLMMDACLTLAPENAAQLRGYLRDAKETARDGFHRVQRFTIDLRPPILDDLGLAPTILWYAERFTQETGTPVEVAMHGSLPALTGDQETALFRILQQALQNIRQHAHARRVDVTVEPRQGWLRVAVADDGVGVDEKELHGKLLEGTHLGLPGMRHRAQLLGGRLEFTSTPGAGTTIVAEIPVQTGPQGGPQPGGEPAASGR